MLATGTRVRIQTLIGPRFESDWSETGRVARWHKSYGTKDRLPEGYQPVRYDSDGAILMLHRSHLMVCNDQEG